jgi:copper chaperone NosL
MRRWIIAASLAAAACAAAPGPAEIRLGEDACAHCRMTIISRRTAAQIVARGEEPVFFDDLRCLNEYREAVRLPDDAVVYVADVASGEWIDEHDAVITQGPQQTPMGSGLVATRRSTQPGIP